MRFRLATSGADGGGQQLAGGVGNLFRSVAMAPAMAAEAAQEAKKLQVQMDLQAAQTALFRNKSAEIDDQRDRSSLGSMLKTAQMVNGVPMSEQGDFGNFLQTGQMAGRFEPPVDGVGPRMPVPKFYDDGTAQRILQTLGLTNTALTVGDSNSLNIAKGAGEYQDQRLVDDAARASRSGDDMALGRINAIRGKKEFTPFGAGSALGMSRNQVTGAEIVSNDALRAIFGDKSAAEIEAEKAKAGASRASAASSYASADNSRASAQKTRQELEQGIRTGDLQVVTGQDGAITVVNKRTLTAEPVLDAQGRPVIKGAAGGGGKALTEGQAKANIFGTRMQESNRILAQLEKEGVLRPGAIKGTAETMGRVLGLGTDTLGGTLSDVAGTLTNFTQSGKQQQVEQARRDFINAVLRRESGAVISPQEFTNAEKQYFPQPNDDAINIEQKRRNRELAATLMLQEVPSAQRFQPPPARGGASGGWDDGAGSSARRISSDAEYNALPSGAVFIGPDNQQRRKP